jgi:hypothetical protein
MNSIIYWAIPYATEQGIFWKKQGFRSKDQGSFRAAHKVSKSRSVCVGTPLGPLPRLQTRIDTPTGGVRERRPIVYPNPPHSPRNAPAPAQPQAAMDAAEGIRGHDIDRRMLPMTLVLRARPTHLLVSVRKSRPKAREARAGSPPEGPRNLSGSVCAVRRDPAPLDHK